MMITFVKLYLLKAKHKHTHMLNWPCACTYPDSLSNTVVKQIHYGVQLFNNIMVSNSNFPKGLNKVFY